MQKIEPDVVSAVKADWFRKLLKKLSEGKPFDMEGLNVVYEIDANKSATEDDARDYNAILPRCSGRTISTILR